MARYEVRELTLDLLEELARLLAERHRAQRRVHPGLNDIYEQRDYAAAVLEELLARDGASGVMVFAGASTAAYVIGTRRADEVWGSNVWIEDAASGGSDPEAIREAYAAAAQRWVDEGRTSHYVLVPATDPGVVDAWFSLSFGKQHVHALREPVPPEFQPTLRPGVTIRHAERRDLPALARMELTLPEHQARSPVFSRLPIPSFDETLAELESDFDDARYTTFVAEHEGSLVGSAVGCSLELSSTNTPLMRPRSAGFLGFAAVVPDARGLGAGRALGEAVMAWSRDAGFAWMATDWRSTNLEANRAWTALGFRPSFLRLHRAIV